MREAPTASCHNGSAQPSAREFRCAGLAVRRSAAGGFLGGLVRTLQTDGAGLCCGRPATRALVAARQARYAGRSGDRGALCYPDDPDDADLEEGQGDCPTIRCDAGTGNCPMGTAGAAIRLTRAVSRKAGARAAPAMKRPPPDILAGAPGSLRNAGDIAISSPHS